MEESIDDTNNATSAPSAPPPKRKLNPVSEEQNVIIEHILAGHNVAVDACAGSGKSTTILSAALRVPHLRVLQQTYNSELRKDVKAQVKELEISNVKVHTFHSLAVRYYLPDARTDTGIRKIILDNLPPKEPIPHYHIIVLDEAQDISFLYFQLMVKFACDMGKPFQIFVLGDYKQGLYQFKGADIRFLTMCEKVWAAHPLLSSRVFHKCTLRTSYRITNEMASFVNEAMLGETRLIAAKGGEPVKYFRQSNHVISIMVISQIRKLLDAGVSAGDIFVLGGSVKSTKGNIRKMENALVENGIPCHVPSFERDKIDSRVMENKVVFSTFHSVKGRQRKYAFVAGFDQSYFQHFNRDDSPLICPNTLYVGCTRATHGLYLLENADYSSSRPLEFLRLKHHQMKTKPYIDFRGHAQSIFYDEKPKNEGIAADKIKTHKITPTGLIQFLPETVIDEISPLLDKIFVNEAEAAAPADALEIPSLIETSHGFVEDVSDINGVAIPSIYYSHIQAKYADNRPVADSSCNYRNPNTDVGIIKKLIDDELADTKEGQHLFLKRVVRDMPKECASYADYLYLSNIYLSVREKLYSRLNQIHPNDYTWLTDAVVNRCLKLLDKHIGAECGHSPLIEHVIIDYDMKEENAKLNRLLSPHFPDGTDVFVFSARTDIITEKSIWEIKCTSAVTIEHKLQLVVYDWIWKCLHEDRALKHPLKKYVRKSGKSKVGRIINVITGEKCRIDATFEELTQIMVAMLKGKYTKTEPKSDDEFIADCVAFVDKQSHLPVSVAPPPLSK